MIPKSHPLAKTAIELRRSIGRLENFVQLYADDEFVPATNIMIEYLKEARRSIPKELLDTDLVKD